LEEVLHHFLAGEPIKARRTGQLERSWLWCRRHPGVASLLGVIAAMTLLVIVGVLAKNAELSRALKDSQDANEAANVRLWESLYDRARAMRMSGQPGQRLESLKSIREAMTLPLPAGHTLDELRTEAIAALALPDVEKGQEWEPLPAGNVAVTFDANFERYLRLSTDRSISVRRIADDVELLRWNEAGYAPIVDGEGTLTLSPDGRHVAVLHPKIGEIRIRRLDRDAAVLVHKSVDAQIDYQKTHDFSPDGKLFLYGLANGRIATVDLQSGEKRLLPAVPGQRCLRINPIGNQFALISNAAGKSAIEVRSLASGELLARLPSQFKPTLSLGIRMAGGLPPQVWTTRSDSGTQSPANCFMFSQALKAREFDWLLAQAASFCLATIGPAPCACGRYPRASRCSHWLPVDTRCWTCPKVAAFRP
jgi:hypothetical protein